MKESLRLTAYCGIYCGDCIHFRNKHSKLARELEAELNRVEFAEYAGIESPFGNEFKAYQEFAAVLKALGKHYCDRPCRVGNGCSSNPCEIMQCCWAKGLQGCGMRSD